MKFLFDIFPVLLFFAAYKAADIYVATAVAIAATFAQIGWMWFRQRKIENMLWVSLVIIVIFGGATALLEFKLVKTDEQARALFDRIDSYFARKRFGSADTTMADSLRHAFTSRFLVAAQGGETFALTSEVAAIDSMIAEVVRDTTFVMDATLAWDSHETDLQGRSG